MFIGTFTDKWGEEFNSHIYNNISDIKDNMCNLYGLNDEELSQTIFYKLVLISAENIPFNYRSKG